MADIFVCSTLTCSQEYTVYDGAGNPIRSVKINGGNGLVNRHLETLHGAVTKVSEDELALLRSHPDFCRHLSNGFLTVTSNDNAEKVASDLEARDESAPMNQNDVDNLMEKHGLDVTLDFDDPTASKKRKRDQ